uniref:Uncharacterized protein n=3 Tax=Bursaphelenchus xylophilus TaxID=6326 RepID=A0A1I7SP83_BURXY
MDKLWMVCGGADVKIMENSRCVKSLKKSTRHETVNSTSHNDEKSRPPGEQHRTPREVIQQDSDKKNEDKGQEQTSITSIHGRDELPTPWNLSNATLT